MYYITLPIYFATQEQVNCETVLIWNCTIGLTYKLTLNHANLIGYVINSTCMLIPLIQNLS